MGEWKSGFHLIGFRSKLACDKTLHKKVNIKCISDWFTLFVKFIITVTALLCHKYLKTESNLEWTQQIVRTVTANAL